MVLLLLLSCWVISVYAQPWTWYGDGRKRPDGTGGYDMYSINTNPTYHVSIWHDSGDIHASFNNDLTQWPDYATRKRRHHGYVSNWDAALARRVATWTTDVDPNLKIVYDAWMTKDMWIHQRLWYYIWNARGEYYNKYTLYDDFEENGGTKTKVSVEEEDEDDSNPTTTGKTEDINKHPIDHATTVKVIERLKTTTTGMSTNDHNLNVKFAKSLEETLKEKKDGTAPKAVQEYGNVYDDHYEPPKHLRWQHSARQYVIPQYSWYNDQNMVVILIFLFISTLLCIGCIGATICIGSGCYLINKTLQITKFNEENQILYQEV